MEEQQFKYGCYCFTLLLNSTHLQPSSEYFCLICSIFLSEYNKTLVLDAKEKIKIALANRQENVHQLDKIIKKSLQKLSTSDSHSEESQVPDGNETDSDDNEFKQKEEEEKKAK